MAKVRDRSETRRDRAVAYWAIGIGIFVLLFFMLLSEPSGTRALTLVGLLPFVGAAMLIGGVIAGTAATVTRPEDRL